MEYKNYSTQVLVKSANDDNLTIDAVISTSEVDRDGESVRQSGIKADVFMENPIVLRQHQRDAIPIGRVVNLKTEDTTTTATIQFSKANPDGEMFYKLYKEGTLTSWSIGFKTLNAINKDGYKELTDIELLEVSSVNIPANINARSKAQSDVIQCDVCEKYMDYKICSLECSEVLEKKIREMVTHEMAQQDSR
ncbi:MAG: HK97 family phage prohead protease [Candidatus Saccharibacteria bacterium]|nr:HK97 family phage prohead protease [Candidatus Saccharibacteria bacterium]